MREGVVLAFVFRINDSAVHEDEIHVAGRENLPIVEFTLWREGKGVHGCFLPVVGTQPCLDEVFCLREGCRVFPFAARIPGNDDALLRDEASHVVDVSVGVVAVEAAGKHEQALEPEHFADCLDDFGQVFGLVAVLAHEAVERRDAEAVAVESPATPVPLKLSVLSQ